MTRIEHSSTDVGPITIGVFTWIPGMVDRLQHASERFPLGEGILVDFTEETDVNCLLSTYAVIGADSFADPTLAEMVENLRLHSSDMELEFFFAYEPCINQTGFWVKVEFQRESFNLYKRAVTPLCCKDSDPAWNRLGATCLFGHVKAQTAERRRQIEIWKDVQRLLDSI